MQARTMTVNHATGPATNSLHLLTSTHEHSHTPHPDAHVSPPPHHTLTHIPGRDDFVGTRPLRIGPETLETLCILVKGEHPSEQRDQSQGRGRWEGGVESKSKGRWEGVESKSKASVLQGNQIQRSEPGQCLPLCPLQLPPPSPPSHLPPPAACSRAAT